MHKNIVDICEYTHMQLGVCIEFKCIICISAVAGRLCPIENVAQSRENNRKTENNGCKFHDDTI